MAYRIEINKEALVGALELAIASNKRATNSAKYAALKPIMEEQTTLLQKAIGSITEVK